MSGEPTLVIEFLSGDPIAEVEQRESLVVTWVKEEFREEIEDLLKDLGSRPLTVRGSARTKPKDGKEGHIQAARSVEPGTEDYLWAVGDALMRSRVRIRGKLVRGVIKDR